MAGVLVRSFLPVSLFLVWVGVLVGLIVGLLGFLQKKKSLALWGFFILAFFAGVFRLEMTERSRPDLNNLYGKNIVARGAVWEKPETRGQNTRLKIKIEKIGDEKAKEDIFILATLRNYPEYKLGDELKIEGVLKKPASSAEFDYAAYLAKEDVFAVSFFPRVSKIGEGETSRIKIYLAGFKTAFEEKIDRVLPEPHSSFLKGLLLGGKESLPEDLVRDFQQTGTAHIVALSGYNITLVGRFFVVILTLFLFLPFSIAFWLASAGIALFVLMAGASASAVRAAVMGILVLLSQKEGRMYNITNALIFAGALMIFQNPRILRFDAGFQLSFLATVGLIFLSPRVEVWLNRILKIKSSLKPVFSEKKTAGLKFKQIFIETTSAQLMVLPLLVYLFGQVSFISPLVNVLVLVAVPYAMFLGFITGISGFLSGNLSMVLGWVIWALLEYKIRVIGLFAKFPAASIAVGEWVVIPIILIYFWLLWRLWVRPHFYDKKGGRKP